MKKLYLYFIILVFFIFGLSSFIKSDNQINLFTKDKGEITFQNAHIILKFDNNMYCKILYRKENKELSINNSKSDEPLSVPSHYITINGEDIKDFKVDYKNTKLEDINEKFGVGKKLTIKGIGENSEGIKIEKTLIVKLFNDYPNVAITSAIYKNLHPSKKLTIDKVHSEVYRLGSSFTDSDSKQFDFWSFQGGSYRRRPDWIVPLADNFSQQNYQGMNAPEYGGGTPVTDLWNRTMGMAVAHIELIFKPVNLPVEVQTDKLVRIGVILEPENNVLSPNEEYETIRTMVLVHDGDCYNGLSVYSSLMQKQGLTFDKFSEGAYESQWCGWGYDTGFTLDDMYGALPKAKELGFKWAVLDYGWANYNGDWFPVKSKFPNGEKDIKAFADKVREIGMKPKLWCLPFDADSNSALAKEHPDWFVLDKNGKKCRISFWNTFYLCPAVPEVQQYQVELAVRYIKDWGYDGLKVDGMNVNLAPPCYNPAHHHKSPYESCEKTAEVLRKVFEKAKSLKPDCVIELCPCGDMASFFNMRANDQPVASDPRSSWQVRHRGKVFKALMGPTTPYHGDHVELSDNANDFASTIGIGGVISSRFTWPNPPTVQKERKGRVWLSPEKENSWKKYVDIYNREMISKGVYLNLYDIGYDKPEGHAIQKGDVMYYSFYAPTYSGKIQLRGLEKKMYEVYDYENDKSIGKVIGPNAVISSSFENHLLVKCSPIKK